MDVEFDRSQSPREDRVEMIFHFLGVAVAHPHVLAYQLSEALHALDLGHRGSGDYRIGRDERDRLTAALARVQIAAETHLPTWVPRQHIRDGFRAAMRQVAHWNLTETEREERPLGDWLEDHSAARVLRNFAHNVVLVEELADRRVRNEGIALFASRKAA